jgi:exodeoxyribonuclease V alpha subunit
MTGHFVSDPKRGEQFRVDTLVPIEPNTLEGLEKYLGSGVVPGVGPGFARRIVNVFGTETLDVLDRDPGRLSQVPGLGQRRVDSIRQAWASHRASSSIMLLLQSHGASAALAGRIVKHYGDRAAAVVQRSPYRLALDVRGVGFATADRLAQSLGISGDHPDRAQAGVWHVLGQWADAGHTVLPRHEVIEHTAAMLHVDEPHIEAAVDALWSAERVLVDDVGVSIARLYRAERAAAEAIAHGLEEPTDPLKGVEEALEQFELQFHLRLAAEQAEAVRAMARHRMVVITGGPGVGKTTIVRAILKVMNRSRLRARLAAPTGRAAHRLSEATGSEASTLHRLLEFDPRSGQFHRHAEHPIDADAVIVDEASMVDVLLAAALLAALPDGARLVLVGDADQLPSVGPGAVLRDLIDSGLMPCVRLQRIHRQEEESRIVHNAHRILAGAVPVSAAATDQKADFFLVSRKDPQVAAELIVDLVVRRIPRRFGLDPIREIQVLCPMHRGPAGTVALNEALQKRLNPETNSIVVRGQRFCVHDKVMQTKNDYEREVFNGDIGSVVSISPAERSMVVRINHREIEYEADRLDTLTLAYAISIHKSQGSEYPAIVMPILTSHFMMLSRNLIYTAVTRARSLCVMVCDPKALHIALAETRREVRHTHLKQWLIVAAAPTSSAGC